jgi:hypothetical protein
MRKTFAAVVACVLAAGCASGRARSQAPATVPAAPPAAAPPAAAASSDESLPLAPSRYLIAVARQRRRAQEQQRAEPCRQPADPEAQVVDDLHRQLYRMMCGASLWFDGLFGEERHPAAAQKTTGRLELSGTYSQRDGAKVRTLFNARMVLPNMQDRVEAFVGRDDQDEFVQGRTEGLALRPLFVNMEREDRWVAGLGYGLPGSYKQKTDVRVGVRGGLRTPETFAQARFRRNFFIGERDLWHFREIVFWTNREGFGATTVVDYDHVISPRRMFRWANTATNSQDTHAWWWRSAFVLYRNLADRQAVAYESFVRGETQAEVPLQEYGLRTIYRRGLKSRPWLYGELVLGYSWPRFERTEKRDGSAAIGLGIEILIGRD